MRPKKLLWQLFPTFLLMATIPLLIVALYISNTIQDFFLNQVSADLESRAFLLRDFFSKRFGTTSNQKIDTLLQTVSQQSGTRLSLTFRNGNVIGDTHHFSQYRIGPLHDPEILKAFSSTKYNESGFKSTLNNGQMHISLPLRQEDSVVAVLRVAVPVTSIKEEIGLINQRIFEGALVLVLIAAVVSLVVSRRIIRPIEELREGAERFAKGNLDISLPLPATEELDGLAYTLNKMAAQLNDRIRTATKQGNEQQAILSSMIEGVIAVDIDENIIIMNQTAGSMLRVSTESIQGKWIFEVIRNTDIRRFIQKTLASDISIEGEIVLLSPQGKERYLQTHGTVLVNSTGVSIGVLVVLHDVTRLKKLENVRREFVANVSHELRTPLTSIKGFVETLVDGAIHDPEGAKRFLNIIINHVNRLNAIVEDLLTISRIEKESETREIQLETTSIRSIITAAVNVCEQKAKERAVTLNVTCDGSLYIIANRFLLEQAIINLVDNAIKYSENESVVSVDVQERNKEIVISVSDNGCGISPEHVPRLFERFYRIDKARSRKQGGTGLGLSIVKHTVLAHGGRVDVKSTVGKGSTFFIYLKAQRDAPVKTSGDLTNHGTPATPYAP